MKYKPQTKEELKELVADESIHLGDIDTTHITDMSNLFENSIRNDFSGIEKWNVSNVVDMSSMFDGAINFNQPLDSWDTSNVENMEYMFYGTESFNQDISSWDINEYCDTDSMFENCLISEKNKPQALQENVEKSNSTKQDISSWNLKEARRNSITHKEKKMIIETLDKLTNCKNLEEAEKIFDYSADGYQTRKKMVQDEIDILISEIGEPTSEKLKELYERYANLKVNEAKLIFQREKNLAFDKVKNALSNFNNDYGVWDSLNSLSKAFDDYGFIGKMIEASDFIEKAIYDFQDYAKDSDLSLEATQETLNLNFQNIVSEYYVKEAIEDLESEFSIKIFDDGKKSLYDVFNFYQGESDFHFYNDEMKEYFKECLENAVKNLDDPQNVYENFTEITKSFLKDVAEKTNNEINLEEMLKNIDTQDEQTKSTTKLKK